MSIVDRLAFEPAFAEERADLLKALGNPVRLRLIAYLSGAEEESVGGLCEALGLPQAKVSQQLASLRHQGIVNVRKEDGFHYYSLAIPRITEMLSCLARSCRVQSTAR